MIPLLVLMDEGCVPIKALENMFWLENSIFLIVQDTGIGKFILLLYVLFVIFEIGIK